MPHAEMARAAFVCEGDQLLPEETAFADQLRFAPEIDGVVGDRDGDFTAGHPHIDARTCQAKFAGGGGRGAGPGTAGEGSAGAAFPGAYEHAILTGYKCKIDIGSVQEKMRFFNEGTITFGELDPGIGKSVFLRIAVLLQITHRFVV